MKGRTLWTTSARTLRRQQSAPPAPASSVISKMSRRRERHGVGPCADFAAAAARRSRRPLVDELYAAPSASQRGAAETGSGEATIVASTTRAARNCLTRRHAQLFVRPSPRAAPNPAPRAGLAPARRAARGAASYQVKGN